MTIDEMIAVLQAYKEGKKIQCCGKISNSVIWHNDSRPDWDFDTYNYRVKPEPHYRPFESAEEVMEAIREHGDWVKYHHDDYRILRISASHMKVELIGLSAFRMSEAYKDIIFADGTPFGKLVEE